MYNCYMTLRVWGGSASLDLHDNLRRIYSRLPNGSRERFDDICSRLHITGQLPTFRDLMEFMQGEATRASVYFTRQHLQGFHHPRDRSKPNYAARLKSKPAAKVSTQGRSQKRIERGPNFATFNMTSFTYNGVLPFVNYATIKIAVQNRESPNEISLI